MSNKQQLKQKRGQQEVSVSVWVNLTKQEIANKRRIREHKDFKAAEARISQARRQGRRQGNSMGWDLDRGFTIENGVKRVWLADALPVGGQQQQEGDGMEVGGA